MSFSGDFFSSLTPFNFVSKLTQPEDTQPGLTFVLTHKLIATEDEYNCIRTNGCAGKMKKNNCPTSKFNYIYRCNKCYKKISPTTGTWFDSSHLSIMDSLAIIFLWCSESKNTTIKDFTLVGGVAVCKYKKKIRQVAIDHWVNNRDAIGGEGKIVEIDESLLFKRKSNVGRLLADQITGTWIVGGIERGSKKCFLSLVKKRDKPTLNELIKFWVKPGTTIYTDCWKGYLDLSKLGYIHGEVNHSKNWLNPMDKNINTQRVERFWRSVKANIPKETKATNKEDYLNEFCFKFNYFGEESLGMRFKTMLDLCCSYYVSPLCCQIN
ncbi:uncharacterized protein LOC107367332 [Tetranychus urticae]|uniref:uncharacterized protein LOC107367332 n=1 Tax=Tetranychus urticae TaxID=32264 RepID=UPI000D64E411|nr:uncharacterized protein LOC107367332 [Tetranychus urticae]XP_025017640.1 uncharacterized protein LOC107367332 [Tetranychus urticae]